MEIRVKAGQYQDLFLFSKSKFPCLKAAIGTGKTLLLLVKVYNFCEQYPGTTALIVRKEYTDLKDSTIKDFERYFGVAVGVDKNYKLPNGSLIMFRHAAEFEVLKNINLGIAGIEQAEEFEDDTQFQFIRDRLRQENGAEIRPLVIIANANGQNWIWKTWINGAACQEIDPATGQYRYINGQYECLTATTFANESHLPKDFVDDCRRKETEAPNHYKQYVLNQDDVAVADDFVFTWEELLSARKNEYLMREGYGFQIGGFDIARYGEDKCANLTIKQHGALHWSIAHKEQWQKKDAPYTIGRIQSIVSTLKIDANIVDEDGLGGPYLDMLNEKIDNPEKKYKAFRNPNISYDKDKFFGNNRTRYAFKLKELVQKGWLCGLDEETCQELMTLRFKYMSDGRRILVSKEEMRAEGIKSPNLADSLIMAVSLIGEIDYKQAHQYQQRPQYSKEGNLLTLAGIR